MCGNVKTIRGWIYISGRDERDSGGADPNVYSADKGESVSLTCLFVSVFGGRGEVWVEISCLEEVREV